MKAIWLHLPELLVAVPPAGALLALARLAWDRGDPVLAVNVLVPAGIVLPLFSLVLLLMVRQAREQWQARRKKAAAARDDDDFRSRRRG